MGAGGIVGRVVACPPPAASVDFSSTADVVAAVRHARSVSLGAYVLPNPRLVRALEGAADGGARVRVRLGAPFHDPKGTLRRANEAVVRELRSHRVDAAIARGGLMHLKAAVVDGRAYLDDRNWGGRGFDDVVTDSDPADVAAVRAALDGRPPRPSPSFAATKRDALDLERDVVAASAGGLDLQSEVIGPGPISSALAGAARREHVRLIVSSDEIRRGPRERRALDRLASSGVEIRIGRGSRGGNDKLCVGGGTAWVGSANATWAAPGSLDWGLRIQDASLVARLRGRFEANWTDGLPFVPAAREAPA